MIDFKLNIGDEVYDTGRRQNGIVTARKYEEGCSTKEIFYNVCYGGPEKVEYEWTEGYWLEVGHRIGKKVAPFT